MSVRCAVQELSTMFTFYYYSGNEDKFRLALRTDHLASVYFEASSLRREGNLT